MKSILLALLFISSCSSARYYQGPAVSQELRKNATSLQLVVASVDTDYFSKQEFLNQFQQRGKDPFITENLNRKLAEMEMKREAVISRTDHIRNLNGELIRKVGSKSKIRENDPVFEEIETFATDKDKELNVLMKDFANYKKASEEFEKLAFFTKMVKR
ncbi:MAG: hypothetical protein V4598_15050 [Bdellovibrionota bacterium]